MAITFTLKDVCAASHAVLEIRNNGNLVKLVSLAKQELAQGISDEDAEIAAITIVKVIGKQQGITTWAQAKTYFSDREIF